VRLLVGDIGGTNTRLATMEATAAGMAVFRQKTLSSRKYPTFSQAVLDFGVDPGTVGACFAIAGPVVDGAVHTSNLPWTIQERELAAEIGVARTHLINDFDAVGHGVTRLGPNDVVELQKGLPVPDGAIALLGPGTGLGQAMLIRGPAGYRVVPSEGGHVTLAARTEIEWGLVRYLAEKYGSHISYERAISGPGLVDTYHYIVERGIAPGSAAVAEEMRTDLPPAVITRHAIDRSDPACVSAAELLVAIFGSQAGNFALTALATGGVYLAGGVSRRILPLLQRGDFLEHFADKGRFSHLLSAVPVYVITSDDVGLLGAAAVALADMVEASPSP
jgi:glucokinase